MAHIWFLKSLPSKVGNLLDLTLKELEKVLYFESHIILDPKDTPLQKAQILSEERYRQPGRNTANPSSPASARRPSSSCWRNSTWKSCPLTCARK